MLALVTGASNGIGKATAKRLAAEGYDLILHCAKDSLSLEKLACEIRAEGRRVWCFQADFSGPDAVKELCGRIKLQAGIPDLIVNNAGACISAQLQDVTDSDYDFIMNVNFRAPFIICREFASAMVSRKSGCIINISSIWGRTGAAMESLYCASKGALLLFSKAIADELAPSGIRVNCISPGCIDTRMNAGYSADEKRALCEEIPMGRFGLAEEIAGTVAFLASRDASYITGEDILADGGFML